MAVSYGGYQTPTARIAPVAARPMGCGAGFVNKYSLCRIEAGLALVPSGACLPHIEPRSFGSMARFFKVQAKLVKRVPQPS